jgi:hypothetical protein
MKGSHLFGYQDQREWLLTFGLGIIILQGVSSRKSLAGVNIMAVLGNFNNAVFWFPPTYCLVLFQVFVTIKGYNGAGLFSITVSNGIYLTYLGQGLQPLRPIEVWDNNDPFGDK